MRLPDFLRWLTRFGQLPIPSVREARYTTTSSAFHDCRSYDDRKHNHAAMALWQSQRVAGQGEEKPSK